MKKSELRQLIKEEASKMNEGYNDEPDMMQFWDFAEIFVEFYDAISKYSKYMDDDTIAHLKTAIKSLNAAYKTEADGHGVYSRVPKVKL